MQRLLFTYAASEWAVGMRYSILLFVYFMALFSYPVFAGESRESVYAWMDISRRMESQDVTAVTVDPDNPKNIWIGAGGALYFSNDGGINWERKFVIRGIGRFGVYVDETETEDEDDLEMYDAALELADELRERIIDDLSSVYGIELAEEMADDLVEEMVEDLLQDHEDGTPEGISRRRYLERYGADPVDIDEYERRRTEFEDDESGIREDQINCIDVASGGRVLVCTSEGLFVSTDYGESFSSVYVGFGEEGRNVTAAAWDPGIQGKIHAGTRDGYWFSTDHGFSFTRSQGISDYEGIRDIAFNPSDSDNLFIATGNGILRSMDGGISFIDAWTSVDQDWADVHGIDFDGRLAGRVYAGSSGGLLISTDTGETFRRVDPDGLLGRNILAIRAWSFKEGAVVAGTSSGVFASSDGGRTFIESYPGLPARNVLGVAPVPDAYPEVVIATSSGAFVWRKTTEAVPQKEWIDKVVRSAPPLSLIADAALRTAEIDSFRFQNAHKRARRAWLLPQLSGIMRIVDNFSERHVIQEGVPVRRQIDLDDDLRWEIRAVWDLDAALHDGGAVSVSMAWSNVRRERTRILDRVTALYGSWVSLSVRSMQVGARNLQEASYLALQIAEVEAQLDILTGGFFTDSSAKYKHE